MAKITTIGLYNFDNTLFDGVVFPAGIDKQMAINEILVRSGEFEVLYTELPFFKAMVNHWASKHYRTFEKWVEGLAAKFDPLYNYDRYEEYEDEKKGTQKSGKDSTQTVANSSNAITGTQGSRSGTNGETVTNDGTTENTVSAFDSSSYEPKDKQEQDSTQASSSISSEASGVNSASVGTSNTQTTDKETGTGESSETIKHTAHLYGNIGVTTSAQMLKEFLDVERFNIYENIADIFIDEFCIAVY